MKEYELGSPENFTIPELKENLEILQERVDAMKASVECFELAIEEIKQELKDCQEI